MQENRMSELCITCGRSLLRNPSPNNLLERVVTNTMSWPCGTSTTVRRSSYALVVDDCWGHARAPACVAMLASVRNKPRLGGDVCTAGPVEGATVFKRSSLPLCLKEHREKAGAGN